MTGRMPDGLMPDGLTWAQALTAPGWLMSAMVPDGMSSATGGPSWA